MTTKTCCVAIYIIIQTLKNELPEQPTCHPVDVAMLPEQFFYINLAAGHPPEMKVILHCNQWKFSSACFTQPEFFPLLLDK